MQSLKAIFSNALTLALHDLYKAEHFIGSLVGIVIIVVRYFVLRLEIFAPKLIYLKAALVYVKMNVALFKIRSAGFPDLSFRVECFNSQPSAVADALAVLLGGYEKKLQMVVVGDGVYFQNSSADSLATRHYSVGLVIRLINTALDRFAGDYLAVIVCMIVALTKLEHRAVFECPLIVGYKLLAVVLGQGNKGNLGMLHFASPFCKKYSSGIVKTITRAHSDT